MPKFETSILISARQEAVWKILSDVARWPEWLPTITSLEPLDGAPLQVRARYKILQPKLSPATWVVTELDPPRRFVWESRRPGVVSAGDHVIEEMDDENVRVTLRLEFTGFLSGLVASMFGSLTQGNIEKEAQTLKRMVEN